MTEAILNLAWVAIALAAFVLAPRRDARSLAALGILVALLFPIVSVTDDLNVNAATYFETLAAILAAAGVIIALVAMARVVVESRVAPSFVLVVHADPRSPPRR
jgi:peptidoglycan/LPS O-acetylase OafA/YrhL